uniref:Mitochondrial ribosomal protein S22 n=1 Tax=Astyanax mexicanus TaxID=7994 RepID=A0A8B9RAC2_ASTMX
MAARCAGRALSRAARSVINAEYNRAARSQTVQRLTCTAAPGSSSSGQDADRLKAVQFADAEVQDILNRITGLDLNKVFQPVKQELKPPKYRLLTDTQLEEAAHKAGTQAKKLLKMPPVLPERKPIEEVLCEDKMLEGMDKAKYVFTDITYNIPHRERFIVVREPSGTLRKASWEERDRLLQVYFPKNERKLTPPPMFKEENLKVHALTYEDIEKNGKYNLLWSTRLFGGLVWHLISSQRIDGLLSDMLQRDRVHDAESLVHLFNLAHPQSDSALQAQQQQASGLELLKIYADCECQRPGFIKLALQVYEQTKTQSSA